MWIWTYTTPDFDVHHDNCPILQISSPRHERDVLKSQVGYIDGNSAAYSALANHHPCSFLILITVNYCLVVCCWCTSHAIDRSYKFLVLARAGCVFFFKKPNAHRNWHQGESNLTLPRSHERDVFKSQVGYINGSSAAYSALVNHHPCPFLILITVNYFLVLWC